MDVRDVSTDDVRIALELKKDADEKMVMAYLFKHTPLQTSFVVNVDPGSFAPAAPPTASLARPGGLAPFRRAPSLRTGAVLARSAEFDALDEILKIVRKSEGKADATQIMKKCDLDAEQTDAILELKIYRLARIEIR